MRWKTPVALVLAIVLPVAVWLLWPSDEARIRKLVRETREAAQAEDVGKVLSAVDYNYTDSAGLSYLYLKKILEQEFSRLSEIQVEYENLRIRVDEGKARASLDVRVIATMGGMTGYYLGDLDNPFALSIELEKGATGKWLVLRAEYSADYLPGL